MRYIYKTLKSAQQRPPHIRVEKRNIDADGHRIPILILRPETEPSEKKPGILWLHGGGYYYGVKEMAYYTRCADLVRKFGVTVISPDYRLAFQAPYPAAIEDCYAALLYMKAHADELNIRPDQLMVGGESSGAGLCASLCMMARDKGTVNIAYQMPLYPMMDNLDTPSSRDNRTKVWNTRKNHFGWRLYLRKDAKKQVHPYAAAARQTDYSNLPPAYSFVGDGEPFYCETLTYIDNLKKAGVPAEVDVYHTDVHCFDLLCEDPALAKEARNRFLAHFKTAMATYVSENN